MQVAPERLSDNLARATGILHDAWAELQRSPYIGLKSTGLPLRLPDLSFAEAERRSDVGSALLNRLALLDLSILPHELALSLRLVQFRARVWSSEARWYWTVIDPTGKGLFGLFLSTAYCGGYLLNLIHTRLASISLESQQDAAAYLALIADYARLIDQFTARTRGQAARGIFMPRAQIAQARLLLSAFKSDARDLWGTRARTRGKFSVSFAPKIHACVKDLIEPAFDRALDQFAGNYVEKAPDAVGMTQFEGDEIYGELVKLHTTLSLTPEQVHARGIERMAEIEAGTRAIKAQLGFDGDEAAFGAHLNGDPRWRANTPDRVADVFRRYMDRVTPALYSDNFGDAPKSAWGVAPLPEALEKSMTFGYYDTPRPDRAAGMYFFNAANLTHQPLFHLAALAYHELIPGHHLQLPMQQKNTELHPFVAQGAINAYSEGWAEYAATWAGEVGLYEAPEEQYGRLVMDALFTVRLVVDTGMNVMGWSLEEGRDYMRRHSKMTVAEIGTESVRYSCDIPAQSLAYKLGDTEMLRLRETARGALGSRFSMREFHAAVLETGAIPLPDLEWHVAHVIERIKQQSDAISA